MCILVTEKAMNCANVEENTNKEQEEAARRKEKDDAVARRVPAEA